MILTTNKSVKDWPEVLAGDEVLATANGRMSSGASPKKELNQTRAVKGNIP